MSRRFPSELEIPERHLPIRARRILKTGRPARVSLTVFCPSREASLPIEACARCSKLTGLDLSADQPSLTCAVEVSTRNARVGALVRRATVCAEEDVDARTLEEPGGRADLVPVVASDDRYLGAVLTGRPTLSASVGDFTAVLSAHASAGEVMTSVPAIHEAEDLLAAAAAMVSNHVRSLPVVSASGAVTGVLDDIALLSAYARKRGALASVRLCSCESASVSTPRWETCVANVDDARHAGELPTCCGSEPHRRR